MPKLHLKTQWIGSSANAINGCQAIEVDGFHDLDVTLAPGQERPIELPLPKKLVATMIAAEGGPVQLEANGEGIGLPSGDSLLWIEAERPAPPWLASFAARNNGNKLVTVRVRLAFALE